MQETQRERPIPLTIALPLSTQEDATADHAAQKPYPLKRAVSIITEQELDLPGLEATSEEELLLLDISYDNTTHHKEEAVETHVCMHVYLFVFVCVYACVFVCVCACVFVCVCMLVYLCVCMLVYLCVCMLVYLCVCMLVYLWCVCLCVCVCVCVRACEMCGYVH